MATKKARRAAYLSCLLADAADSVREAEDSPEDRYGLTLEESRAIRDELAASLDRRAVRILPDLSLDAW